ncbi:hypothetical protein DB347_10080 [Opitutaceae bacterium EW11]|nr:hypothetical protein DB347_10080 [Opitutaceae bacterium EW11]
MPHESLSAAAPPAANLGYEPKDASPRVIAITVAILGGGIFMTLAVCAWLYLASSSQTGAAGPRQTSFAEGWREKTGIEQDQEALRREVEAHLNSYGWIDNSKRRVRIPIDRAMEQMAREGAAKTKPTEAAEGRR